MEESKWEELQVIVAPEVALAKNEDPSHYDMDALMALEHVDTDGVEIVQPSNVFDNDVAMDYLVIGPVIDPTHALVSIPVANDALS